MESKITPFQRILALFTIILLIAMIIATLLVAIFLPGSRLFAAFLLADIAIPIIGFIWIQTYKWYKDAKQNAKVNKEE